MWQEREGSKGQERGGEGKLGDWRLVQTNKSLQIYFSAMRSAKLLRHAWAVSARETETATEQQQRERGGRGAKVATAAQTQRGRDGIDAPVKNARFQRGN